MRADDQFHIGIVVDDFDRALANLHALFGYEWCDKIAMPVPVSLPTGDTVVDLEFAYSASLPRLEIIQTIPDTLWVPVTGSGIHHVGYWSDDVVADSGMLTRHGFTVEASGVQPDGTPYWAYHRSDIGPRVEIVSRAIQPGLEQYWATGPQSPVTRRGGGEG